MLEDSDYGEVLEKYHDDFLRKYAPAVDLSGWEYSPLGIAPALMPPPPRDGDLKRYYADSGSRLSDYKSRISVALEEMGCRSLDINSFTVLPSTTTAITITLSFLKERGVTRILVEAPAYYAVIISAKRLGFHCDLLEPLEMENGIFATDLEACEEFLSEDGVCLWFHQPRYSIGQDLTSSSLLVLATELVGNRFIIVDEANDDSLPNHMNMLDGFRNVIRIRSLAVTAHGVGR